MIVRPRPHWFSMLFIWRGSVLKKLLPRLLIVFLIGLGAVLFHGYFERTQILDLNPQPFTLLGLALAIFLGFRTNVSYDRYWEARKLWGSILNYARALARQALTVTAWTPDTPEARRFVLGLAATAHALRHQLRDTDASADLQRLLQLPEADLAKIKTARFPPILIVRLLAEQLHAARRQGQLSDTLALAMEKNLDGYSDSIGGCERILTTPVPLTFSLMVHRTVYFYCSLLPFALAASIGWLTPVFAAFVAYAFMALEAIAEELEQPFGADPNDLPLQAMSQTIEASLLEMLGDVPPPAAPVPQNYVVL